MVKVSLEQIKKLRQLTGVSVAECKKALEEAGGDEKRALELLQKLGLEIGAKKTQRPVGAGVVETYIHHTLTSGATIVLGSETDFVARNPEFKQLAHEIAAQVAFSGTENVVELLKEPWIRDETKTIGDLINENIAKFGENIKIKEVKKFQV